RVFDALVDGQDREVAGAAQAAGREQLAEVAEHRHRPVGVHPHPVDEVGPGQVQLALVDAVRLVRQQRLRLVAQQLLDLRTACDRHLRTPAWNSTVSGNTI